MLKRKHEGGSGGIKQHETLVKRSGEETKEHQQCRQHKGMISILAHRRKLHDDMEVLERGRREMFPQFIERGV